MAGLKCVFVAGAKKSLKNAEVERKRERERASAPTGEKVFFTLMSLSLSLSFALSVCHCCVLEVAYGLCGRSQTKVTQS